MTNNLNKFKTSESDMLNFYRQTEAYYQAKLKAAEYESKDSKFLIYY